MLLKDRVIPSLLHDTLFFKIKLLLCPLQTTRAPWHYQLSALLWLLELVRLDFHYYVVEDK